jgi:hypothetical protein
MLLRDIQWFESMKDMIADRAYRKIIGYPKIVDISVRELKSQAGYGVFEFEARW